MEAEANDTLPFLVVFIMKQSRKLTMKVYQKPTTKMAEYGSILG
jgi:hypothetical protein